MHANLPEVGVKNILGNSEVTEEYRNKVKELTRRLKMNGIDYNRWDTLTDNHQMAFSEDMFLEPTSAECLENYVNDAVGSCGCGDVVSDLHDHSPALIGAIEQEQENHHPHINIQVGEGFQYLDSLIDNMLVEFIGVPDKEAAEFFGSEEYNELLDKLDSLGKPKSPQELYDNASQVALKELEKHFGKGWIDNTAEKWKVDGKKIKNPTLEKEGSPGRMWRLTNAGNRASRNAALEKIREELDFAAYGAQIQTVEDEEGDRYKKGFLVRLSMVFKFPAAGGKTIDVPWQMDLREGMGAGGTAEGQQLSVFQQALAEAVAKNNGQPVTIEFPQGLGTVSGVAKIISGPKREERGRVGDPKTDFALQDKDGNNIYFLSAKEGKKPSNFNQWGGFANVSEEAMGEVRRFAASAASFILDDREKAKTDGDPLRHYDWVKFGDEYALKRLEVGEMPMGVVITKPVENRMLKLKAVFGEDFGTVNPETNKANHGLDYVNATFQMPRGSALDLEEKTEGDPGVLVPTGFSHVFGPAQFSGYPAMADVSGEQIDEEIDRIMGRGYHPVLLLRRAESGRKEGVYRGAAVETDLGSFGMKIPSKMKSVRFGIFPAENRAVTHVMNDNFGVEAVWDKEGALASGACGSWMCRKSTLEASGGAVKIDEDGSRSPLDLTSASVAATIIGASTPIRKNPSRTESFAFNKFKLPAADIKR